MIILQIAGIGYTVDDENHSIGYYNKVTNYLKRGDYREFSDNDFKFIWGENFDNALKVAQQVVFEEVTRMNFNPSDFYFTVTYSEFDDDMFWLPSGFPNSHYRVSDTQVINN